MIFILVYGLLTANSNNDYLWIDESFTISMIQHNYADMVSLTSLDVHPPLYYVLLKLFVQSVTLINPRIDLIIISRFFSIIPMFILGMITITWVRKSFGNFSSSSTLLALCAGPLMLKYATDIRMYSWGILFVSLAFMSFYFCCIKMNWVNLACLSLSSLLAAYTHYYAAVAVSLFWFILLTQAIRSKKKSNLKYLVLGICLCILCYLPWIIILFKQISTIKGDYWIEPITIDIIEAYFEDTLSYSFWLVLLIPGFLRNNKKSVNNSAAIVGVGLLFYVVAFGIALSILIRPFFVIRYAVPTLFCYWLGMSILFGQSAYPRMKPMLVFIILLLFINTVPAQINFLADRKSELYQLKLITDWKSATILSDSNRASRNFSKILNTEIIDISGDTIRMLPELYKNMFPEVIEENLDSIIWDVDKNYYYIQKDDSYEPNFNLLKKEFEFKPVWKGYVEEPLTVYEIEFCE